MPFINFNTARPALKLAIIFLSIVTIGIIVFFISILLGRLIFWMHLDEVNHVLYGRHELLTDWQLKFFQLMQSVGFFLIPGFFLHWIFSSPNNRYFELKKRPALKSVLLIIAVFIVAMPLINWLVEFNKNIELPSFLSGMEKAFENKENLYAGLTERLLFAPNAGHLIFNIIMIAVIPAIGEELIFRGVLQKLFSEVAKNIHISIFITAFIFSSIHGQFYGFIPRFLLGLFFGYLMYWSKTIWLPIIAHFVNNLIAVLAYYFISNEIISGGEGAINYSSFLMILASAGLLAVIIIITRRSLQKEESV